MECSFATIFLIESRTHRHMIKRPVLKEKNKGLGCQRSIAIVLLAAGAVDNLA